eukprot:635607_1
MFDMGRRHLTMTVVVLFALFLSACATEQKPNNIKVAIIGSGIGGSSVASFLSELEGHSFSLDIFERQDHIGGRVSSIEIDGVILESGAAIVIEQNRYMKGFAEKLNITRKHSTEGGNAMGFWNGKEFVFTSEDSWIPDPIRLIYRYGMSLLRSVWETRSFVKVFDEIYSLQSSGVAYRTPEELFSAMDLYSLTQTTFLDHIRRSLGVESDGRNLKVVEELLTVCVRNNYNSEIEQINALAGLVGTAPMATGTGSIWSAEGGNVRICEALIQQSGATLHLNTEAISVTRNRNVKNKLDFTVEFRGNEGESETKDYDLVIVATPLEFTSLALKINDPTLSQLPTGPRSLLKINGLNPEFGNGMDEREFRTTHQIFVSGSLNEKFFGRSEKFLNSLSSIEVTREMNVDKYFTSIGLKHTPTDGTNRIYKMFSRQKLSDDFLSKLFNTQWRVRQYAPWKAYPRFAPPEEFLPFVLDEAGLFYLNTIENAASAMEMVAVAAKNVALLIDRKLNEDDTSPDGKKCVSCGEGVREEL